MNLKFRYFFLISLLLGLIYIFLIPPWQHNDEPGNFEYAWLISNRNSVPQIEDYDPTVRREISASMIENNFLSWKKDSLNLITVYEATNIAIQQRGDPLGYFGVAALFLRIFKGFDVTFQLYIGRLISLVFMLMTVYFGYASAKLLFGDQYIPISLMVLLIGAQPGVVDKLTAVNDDVFATTSVSLVIWMSIWILKRGLNIKNIIGILIGILCCFLSKGTAWIGIPIGIIAIVLGFLWKHRELVWLFFLFVVISAVYMTLLPSKHKVAYFYSYSADQIRSDSAPAGEYIFGQKAKTSSVQVLDRDKVTKIAGKEITLGLYMWGDTESSAIMPVVVVDGVRIFGLTNPTTISQTPSLRIISGFIPPQASKISLHIFTNDIPSNQSLYLDCIFLTDEKYDHIDTTIYHDSDCKTIYINGKEYKNYLKNASAEFGWPVFRSEVMNLIYKSGYVRSESDIWALFDFGAPYDYYIVGVAANIFRTYWGGFGWGGVRLSGSKPYRIFLFIVLIAAILNAYHVLYKKTIIKNWSIVTLLSLLTFCIFVFAIYRAISNFYIYTFTPTARYILPAVIPISAFLSNGWGLLFGWLEHKKKRKYLFLGFVFFLFLSYNIWAWYTILEHFNNGL